ncbi:sulfite exporter TauE/SafE family protein [Candidatus Lokiarchaeum ossiferum]
MNEYWILIFVFLSSFVYGLIGFGDALILIPIASPIIGIQAAIILVTIWGVVPSVLNLIQYRHFMDKKFLIRAILTGIPGAVIGSLLLLLSINLRWVELLLGCFILTYSILKIRSVLKTKEEIQTEDIFISKEISEPILIIGGFSYGLFGGLIGASGPINVALLEGTGHYKENFIGNFAAIGFPLTILKISLYIATDSFPKDNLLIIFLIGLPIIIFASKLGHKLTPKIPVETFRLIILVALIIIGIRSILKQTIFYT